MIVVNHTQLINFYYNKILSGWKNDTASTIFTRQIVFNHYDTWGFSNIF